MKLILCLMILSSHAAWAGPVYNITDLGTLGGTTSMAYALNDAGHTAGTATTNFGNMDAMSYGVPLAVSAGGINSSAWGVNNGDQISGTQYIGGQTYATVWNNGAPQLIAGAGSYGTGINQSGDIAGMFTNSGGQGEAFIVVNGVMQALGTLQDSTWSSAYGINNSDQAAGYAQTGSGMRGFVWSAQTGYSVLGTLGGINSYAMAINDSGQVAGHAQTASGYMHAALWNDGGVRDLGTLNGGNSYAYGLDNSGDVVGTSGSQAFLYQNGVMLDLNLLTDSGSGWTLTQAYAINSVGEIAGAGLFNGVEHAYLLDLAPQTFPASAAFNSSGAASQFTTVAPEPAAWTLMLLGLGALLAMKARPGKARAGTR
jgi:probable HAF family extracellular repeat protein